MSQKDIYSWSIAGEQLPEVFEDARSPASAMARSLAGREAALLAGEQAVLAREIAVGLRENALREQEAAAVARAVQSARTETQLRQVNERLVVAAVRAQSMREAADQTTAHMSHRAEHDFLTGLPNRALLNDRLAQSIMLAQRRSNKVALMYMDIDRFKNINDSLGHEVGDQLLKFVATRLQEFVRHSDTVSRQGGDEFIVLLAEVNEAQDAVLAAEKLIAGMSEPHLINGHFLRATLSIGISLYPDDGADAETVIRNADIAMYQAKKAGRNNFRVFTQDMNVREFARQSIEQELHNAFEKHQFVLHYQPKVSFKTGAITGAEALLRMRRADLALVSPEEFVSIAEDCGLIQSIGNWVLREACRQTQAWIQAGLGPCQIAVNVSAKQFQSKDFVDSFLAILNDTGLDPHHIVLELTESGFMQDTDTTTETLHALRKLGVQIAIDDFGTGYSSLSYLRHFPVDIIKVDQSFVREIKGEKEEATLVSAIIAMGKGLKLQVVAEGIETIQQLAYLKSEGCMEGQGFLFSRPVAGEEFATLLTLNGTANSTLAYT